MGGLEEGCKKPYSQQVGCIIKLALRIALFATSHRNFAFPDLFEI